MDFLPDKFTPSNPKLSLWQTYSSKDQNLDSVSLQLSLDMESCSDLPSSSVTIRSREAWPCLRTSQRITLPKGEPERKGKEQNKKSQDWCKGPGVRSRQWHSRKQQEDILD
ncbi:hypothetical protein HNY73_011160 [Argiope bruennichi]|uniref:Uncharacterized protein n=1 Tax=Argiope bruennichi TaxID=94029 RepID=A0A8T0F5V1_ARGBR|nr:hypothetical protein HNY73_011160 [Argiope bruennichi]